MLTIEDIKKGCVYTEGFDYHERSCSSFSLIYKQSCFEIEYDTLKHSSNTETYELFLQRVMEGIRKHPGNFYIEQTSRVIDVTWYMHPTKPGHMERFLVLGSMTIDQAKEEAIKYIFNQKLK